MNDSYTNISTDNSASQAIDDAALAPVQPAAADGEVQDQGADVKKPKKAFATLALLSLLLTIAAWLILLLPLSTGGFIALAVALVAVVTAAIGLKAHRRFLRDIATTSIIASSILAIVVISFIIVLYVVL